MSRRPGWLRMPMQGVDEPPSASERAGWTALYGAGAGEPQGEPGRIVREQMDAWSAPEPADATQRAKPVQWEAAEQSALQTRVQGRWWAPGFRHHDLSNSSLAAGGQKKSRGARRGWPDVTTMIPRRVVHSVAMRSLLLACELKREDARPKRAVGPVWWLDWARERPVEGTTRHGLYAEQAVELLHLDMCGWLTFVAYGHESAAEWIDSLAGPEPSEPIDWPRVSPRIDDWR